MITSGKKKTIKIKTTVFFMKGPLVAMAKI